MIRSHFLLIASLSAFGAFAQSSSERAAVQLSATVQASPAAITLNWTVLSSTTSITIYRKLRSATAWGSALAAPAASALQYVDNTVAVGTGYEYKVERVSAGVVGTGYISTGIQVPAMEQRGKIILLVDNTVASSLSVELTQLRQDLKADGWGVLRSDVSPTASVSSVRSTVIAQYNTDPANVKALFIIGHVPVAYSGNVNPDGHSAHLGAWPCDAYYGELNSTWTDNTVNSTGGYPLNQNVPGDGKFDQSDLPSAMELQVGRVDMNNMPAFALSEVELLRAYLNKAHSYKVKGWVPQVRGIIFDNLQWVSNPLAGSGWRNLAPLVGPSTITAPYQYGTPFKTLIDGQSYLWTYESGGGLQGSVNNTLTFNGADNVGTTEDYAALAGGMDGVFNMSFGSYFGDWSNPNNFLRAPLAKGDALTNVWSSIPAWYFHHMGMGEPIGTSALVTMNNTGLYSPLTDGWAGGRIPLGLMGDPSLRQFMVAPPTALNVSNVSGTASFSWAASAEAVQGYYLYQIDAAGTITRLVSTLITGTTYQNAAIPYVTGREYMVRAVKLQTSPSGTYYDLSLGALVTAGGAVTTDCQGVAGGTALPGAACNDGNACTTNDIWNASCQCVGTSSAPIASITAAGATAFCPGGSVVLNANTGAGLTYAWRKDGVVISGATSASYTASAAGSYSVVVSNGSCSGTSGATVVTITSSMVANISTTTSQVFCTGGSIVLTANAGSGYTYQWYKNGTAISGATAISYTATTTGGYSVTVSSGSCSATSSSTPVQVNAGPTATITASGSTSFCTGGSVVLSANTGSGLNYTWYKDGSAISGATASSYTATTSGNYTVAVSNGTCSASSAAAVVTATSSITATITAAGATSFCTGGSVVLNANTGTGLTYVWKKDGVAISGATASSYTATASGNYTVVVTNGTCTGTSAATTVTSGTTIPATITAAGATSFCTGGSVVLNANTGTGLTYVWKKDGVAISGATAGSYTATATGNYTVVVSSGTCSATSAATAVTSGTTIPATITAAGATSFCTGGSVVLNANTGTGLTYAWKKDGVAISGATSASYTATASGNYTVLVSNGTCSATSAATAVNASSSSLIANISTTTSQLFCQGGSVVLTANAGTGYTYQWYKNGAAISGATTISYTATTTGGYSVMVSGGSCSATSSSTPVQVNAAPTVTCSVSGATATVTATGGTTPYTYAWNSAPVQTTATATFGTSGTYTVSVTGANGCAASCSSTVSLSDPCAGIRTEAQTTWGATPTTGTPAMYMTSNFAVAFPSGLSIGCTRKLLLTSAAAVTAFLPSTGTAANLPSGTLTNPTTYSNQFAGQLVALKLAMRFDELNATFSPATALLKDMTIATGTFAGWTVQQLVDECDRKIGGCASLYLRSTLNTALTTVNEGYEGGIKANGYLSCPAGLRSMEEMAAAPAPFVFTAKAFPNPTSGRTTLELNLPEDLQDEVWLEVRSLEGALMDQHTAGMATGPGMRIEWDASGLAPGLYLCQVRCGGHMTTARVMVE